MKRAIFSLALLMTFSISAWAQGMVEEDKKLSFSATADGSMLQLAMLEIGAQSELSTLRYSYFLNGGLHANYSLSDKLTFFTGIGVKNLGFIIKGDDTTSKYRVYTAGIPLGLKIGKLKEQYAIIGGGVDFPLNYQVKLWEGNRKNKSKANKWFSNEVSRVLPYITAGYRFKNSFTAKILYYPTNFWNDDFWVNTNANLMVLTLGFDVNTIMRGNSFEISTSSEKE